MSVLVTARFHTTVAQARQLPPDGIPEVAFIGRSNAGKSSAINVLCQRRRLAFAPVLNVVLVFRALLDGEAKPLEYTLTALALLAYTLIATQVAVRLLAREPSSGERRRAWFGFARGGAA